MNIPQDIQLANIARLKNFIGNTETEESQSSDRLEIEDILDEN